MGGSYKQLPCTWFNSGLLQLVYVHKRLQYGNEINTVAHFYEDSVADRIVPIWQLNFFRKWTLLVIALQLCNVVRFPRFALFGKNSHQTRVQYCYNPEGREVGIEGEENSADWTITYRFSYFSRFWNEAIGTNRYKNLIQHQPHIFPIPFWISAAEKKFPIPSHNCFVFTLPYWRTEE